MDFYQKYELLDLLKDEGVKVFNAREIATGRQITMFLFVGEQARLHADLLEQLRASQRPDRPDLLEVGDNQGTPFVATEPLDGLAGLKRKAAASPSPPAAPSAGRLPDAFTRVGVWHIPAPTISDARGGLPATPPPPGVSAAPAGPGEFTRMFQASVPPQPMGEGASPAAAPSQAPPAPAAAGEFTRMFQAAPPRPMGEAAPPAASPAPSAQAGVGEFTRFFQSPLSQAQTAAPGPVFPPPPAVAPPKPPPPVSSAPGEFTRIFGRGDLPAAQAGPPRPEFTPPAPPAPSAGPGEYTRMFSAQPVLESSLAPAAVPAAAPTTAKKVPWLTLALIVAVVVLLAVVAIMAFALRK